MDHETATRIRAPERYALEELTPEESAEFEAHYFDCAECAGDVKAAVSFTANARVWFERQAEAESRDLDAADRRPFGNSWWTWLRPAWVSPAFACLFAALAGYSWLVAIPHARQQAAPVASVEALEPVLLRGELRGETAPVVRRSPGAPVALFLNVESERQYPGYQLEILGPSGASIAKTGALGGSSIALRLSGNMLSDGIHTIVLRGDVNGRPEIGKYRFEVRTSGN